MSEKKILIVEDDRNLLDTLVYNIKKEGYAVISSANGEESIDLARREKPALIVLDIMLPGMLEDSIDALKQVFSEVSR